METRDKPRKPKAKHGQSPEREQFRRTFILAETPKSRHQILTQKLKAPSPPANAPPFTRTSYNNTRAHPTHQSLLNTLERLPSPHPITLECRLDISLSARLRLFSLALPSVAPNPPTTHTCPFRHPATASSHRQPDRTAPPSPFATAAAAAAAAAVAAAAAAAGVAAKAGDLPAPLSVRSSPPPFDLPPPPCNTPSSWVFRQALNAIDSVCPRRLYEYRYRCRFTVPVVYSYTVTVPHTVTVTSTVTIPDAGTVIALRSSL